MLNGKRRVPVSVPLGKSAHLFYSRAVHAVTLTDRPVLALVVPSKRGRRLAHPFRLIAGSVGFCAGELTCIAREDFVLPRTGGEHIKRTFCGREPKGLAPRPC